MSRDRYVENLPCLDCGNKDSLGVYQREDGSYHAKCFDAECGVHNNDPYEGGTPSKRTKEAFQDESEAFKIAFQNIENLGFHALKSRGISKEICELYNVKSRVDPEGNDLVHYYQQANDNEVTAWMERRVDDKKFRNIGHFSSPQFFGQTMAGSGGQMIVVTEGQCLLPHTEVLTRYGWVKLEDYKGVEVLQVDSDLKGSFTNPIAVVDKVYTGDLYDRGNSKGFSEISTEDHSNARLYKGAVVKQRSSCLSNKHLNAPRTLNSVELGGGVDDNLVRLMVAFQADGTERAGGSKDFGFSKDSKINRLTQILDELAVDYIEYAPNKRGMTVFRIYGYSNSLPEWVWSKSFSIAEMLLHFDKENLEVFVREQRWWDGNTVVNRDQDEYNNTDLCTVEAVQLASHLSGYCSTIRSREGPTNFCDNPKIRYTASILYSKQSSSVQLDPKVTKVTNERVMCLQVPTGFFMYRLNGDIGITGNCDAMAAKQLFKEEGKNYRVVSIPNGASNALRCFRENYEWVDSFKNIILAFDMDDPGRKSAEEVAALFEPNRVKTMFMSEKDPNEMLRQGKSREFLSDLYEAKEAFPDGIVSVDDLYEEAIKPPEVGLSFPFPTLSDSTYGYRRRELYGVGAGSGCGKTECFKEFIDHTIFVHKLPVGVIFLEEPAAKTLKVLAGKHCNRRFHIPDGDWTIDELIGGINAIKGMAYFYNHSGSKDWQSIKPKIKYMVRVLGIHDIYLDHLTALVAQEENEYKALNKIMEELSSLTHELDCTIFYISHLRKANGTPHEEGGHVSADQFKGSGAIVFWSNFIFGLERNQQAFDIDERNTTTFRVLKDRNTGLATGLTFKLKYHHDTGRWLEIDETEFDDEANDD